MTGYFTFKLKSKELFLFSVLTAQLTSLPGLLFRNSLDWDEDVFQYVTQRMVFHFELPYTSTFENKPPLAYLLYSIPVFLQPEEKLILRIFASILLSIIAYTFAQLFLTEESFRTKVTFILAFVFTYRLYPGGFTWLTELNGLTVLVFLLYLAMFIIKQEGYRLFVAYGFLCSCVILTRSNLFFPVAFLSILLFISLKKHFLLKWSQLLCFFLGFMSVFVALTLLYYGLGHFQDLYKGLIQLPLSVSSGGSQIQFGIRRSFLYLAGILLSAYLLQNVPDSVDFETKFKRQMLIVTHIGLLLSIMFNLPNFGHHLLQIIPTTLTLVFLAIRNVAISHNLVPRISMGLLSLGLIAITIFQSTPRPDSLLWQQESRLTQHLKDSGLESGDTLWSPDYTYLYSKFRTSPITSIFIHPANIGDPRIISTWKGRTYSQSEVVDDILKDSPEWLVFNVKGPSFKLFLGSSLSQNYKLRKEDKELNVVIFFTKVKR